MPARNDTFEGKTTPRTFSRVGKYILFRAATLIMMMAVGIFLAIVIINYGGYIDNIHRADIDETLNFVSLSMRGASTEEVAKATEQLRWSMEEAYGLHSPFLLRCARWFSQAVTFDLGVTYRLVNTRFMTSAPVQVRTLVLERVPYTLLLAGSTNIILFFASIFVSSNLSKKHGSLLDRLMISLSPLSSVPNWVYGIILTVIFAGELHILPLNGVFDTFPPATKWGYIPIVLKHMVLPVTAIFLGTFFSAVYTWRTFFLIHSGEDYLELAKAKGVPARILEQRYVLKPTLPYIITSFAMLIVTFWQGIIVLEVFFDWPGVGQLFMLSIAIKEISVTIGIMVIFAYLLGISVFLLDIIYVLVDPRVRISTEGQTVSPYQRQSSLDRFLSTLRFLSPRRLFLQLEALAGRVLRNLRDDLYSLLPIKGLQSRQPMKYFPSPGISQRRRAESSVVCPYLRHKNNSVPVLDGANALNRCFIHNRPERIGTTFQVEVCRTGANHTCPRKLMISAGRTTLAKENLTRQGRLAKRLTGGFSASLREFHRFPVAIAGLVIIMILIGISIYTMITIPYKEAVARWGPETVGKYQLPKNALPVWINFFRKDPLPATIIQNSADGAATAGTVSKSVSTSDAGVNQETITYTFDYPYTSFPQDLVLTFNGKYEKKPFVTLTWLTPDGREDTLGNFSAVTSQRFVVSQDLPEKYLASLPIQTQNMIGSGKGGAPAVVVLFMQPGDGSTISALKGTYSLKIEAMTFEPGSSLDAEMILYGRVYGLAGTDDHRRDLMVALLWGIPIALAFGFLGALSTGLISMIIAAIGVWFGGKVDGVIQRLTEINMILPTLPIAITIYYLYSKSIWMILGIIILLSIFGTAIKTYRSAFLQIKELPYIEAAQSYGASNWRIIRHYLVPRIVPLLIPQLVILVPSYVFFEATLAYLQVSDPILPTWGKVVYDALTRGAFQGYYYWVLEPVALMMLTAMAFAVVGFALDSILNPRLRRI